MRCAELACAMGLISSLLVSRASAQPSQGLSLVFDGPPTCVSPAEFLRRFHERLSAHPLGAVALPKIVVHIAQADGQYVGRLSLLLPDGTSTTRTLSARDCGGLVDALALIAALTVRSQHSGSPGQQDGLKAASPSPPAATAPEPATPVPAPASPSHSESQGSSRPEEPVTQELTPLAPSPGAERIARGSSNPALRSRVGGDAGVAVTSGVAPLPTVSGLLGFDWVGDRASFLSPALELAALAGMAPQVTRPDGKASFAWLGARLSGCALRWAVSGSLHVRGCLLGDAGWVLASGSETVSPRATSRAWLSLGVSSQFEYSMSARFAVRWMVGVEVPTHHDRYAFASDRFFQVPVVTVTGSGSIVAYLH